MDLSSSVASSCANYILSSTATGNRTAYPKASSTLACRFFRVALQHKPHCVGCKHMCGRFVRKRSSTAMAKDFGVQEIIDDLQPSFNIPPTHNVAVVLNKEHKQLVAMRWGLVPYWATDPKMGSKLINARAETLNVKAAFKEAFKRRRCLVI